MAYMIEETLKQMHQDGIEKTKREVKLYGGIRMPKCKHKFSLQVDNPSLTEDEKTIFSNQVIEAFIQESILPNNNIFTVVIDDDLHNNIVDMLVKLNKCNFILTYFAADAETVAVTNIRGCELLFNRSHVSYAESAQHQFKLIYSFGSIQRTTV